MNTNPPTAYTSRRPPVTWLTCTDNRDHATKTMIGTTGIYEAACGAKVLPAASQDPPNPPCLACQRYITAWRHERALTQRFPHRTRHTKPTLLHRLFRRCPR
ncbi:hypothetical protein ACFQV2_19470 [Actinokineospora soli]|uniref:Zinc-finger n=1 Tax=Actinokineospora soli TaxID=1048753 RepID=A0ABW2TNI4_9PSEU